ncbi:hypothetical protein C4D60_Mb10t00050 [Musa balbisiana]|uniref:Uncharacterized protein n=1 Tax=Musa balbisiana TaxID=52838 RepID=A0A4S8IUW5_MUSBA|nr:hypothetical protein C4D60_Mb10t00050 [Musa balbisiana]
MYRTLRPERLVVADLGCSSGPNNLFWWSPRCSVSSGELRRRLDQKPPEIQFFLNDLPGNDFNNVFRSLESPKAMEAAKSANSVRVFFDWNDYLKLFKMGTYWPYTPSIQPLHGLRTAPDLLLAVEAWGLKNRTQEEWWFHLVLTALLWWFHLVLTALIIVKVFRIGHLGNLTDTLYAERFYTTTMEQDVFTISECAQNTE